MQLVHVTVAARGRAVLAPNEAERRRIVRALARRHGQRVLLFALVDDHLHAVLAALRARMAARGLRATLGAATPVALEEAHVRPVESRRHLESLVAYLLKQPTRHGLPEPAALWSGSAFLDLVGARRLPGFDPRLLLRHLPRFRLRDVFPAVGLEPLPLRPAGDAALERLGPRRLVDLAAAVHVAPPDLSGRSDAVVAARALAIQTARGTGVSLARLAELLRLGRQTVWRLANRPLDPADLRALRLRLALEERAAAADPASAAAAP